MRLQFVFGTDMENTIDIDVSEVPIKETEITLQILTFICVVIMHYRSTYTQRKTEL